MLYSQSIAIGRSFLQTVFGMDADRPSLDYLRLFDMKIFQSICHINFFRVAFNPILGMSMFIHVRRVLVLYSDFLFAEKIKFQRRNLSSNLWWWWFFLESSFTEFRSETQHGTGIVNNPEDNLNFILISWVPWKLNNGRYDLCNSLSLSERQCCSCNHHIVLLHLEWSMFLRSGNSSSRSQQ